MDLADLVERVRSYRGVVRKAPVASVARGLIFGTGGRIVAAHGEDAAAIRHGKGVLLLAADGIIRDLVEDHPRWAGYCSVLVNANDIAAMGGVPVAAVNVLSCADPRARGLIVRGMREGCEKFGVPMVGGHLHPDTQHTAVEVAMLGRTTPSRLVLSTGARAGDAVVFAMDLDGRFTRGVPYSWDTTSHKTPAQVQSRLRAMNRLAPRLTAGKDISNPGSLGTLGMLLEASAKGAVVDIGLIPRPAGVDRVQWLLAYQGCGFVATCAGSSAPSVVRGFRSRGLSAAVCGTVRRGRVLTVEMDGQAAELFDLRRDILGCRVPQKI